jgi:hypothetical protein
MLKITLGLPCVRMKVLVLVCMVEMGGGGVGGWVSYFSLRSCSCWSTCAFEHKHTGARAHSHTHTQEILVQ